MNLKEIDQRVAAARLRLFLHRQNAASAEVHVPPFGYFELDMFECPPFVMFANNDVPVLEYIISNGTFEPRSLSVWCRLAKTATGFLDIGANVGIYSLAAAKLRPEIAVHAYEPNPYAYARLRMHKFINDVPNLIEHASAVHPKMGVSMFTWLVKPFGNISSGGHLEEVNPEGVERLPVNIAPIDGSGVPASLGKYPLVKIDVEGAELLVFEAMKEVLELKPDIILETFRHASCDSINAQLLPRGYSVYGIHEKTGQVTPKSALSPCDPRDPSRDFNQLLSARPPAELMALIVDK